MLNHQMKNSLTKVTTLLFSGAAVVLSATSALSQTALPPPSPFEAVDQLGVELSSGTVQISSPTISVGPDEGGLSFTATWDSRANGWRYSNWGAINKPVGPDRYCQNVLDVTFMGATSKFQREGCSGPYRRIDGLGSGLIARRARLRRGLWRTGRRSGSGRSGWRRVASPSACRT
jgi:hypothetical protein